MERARGESVAVIAAYKYTSEFLAAELRQIFELREEIRILYLDEEERGAPEASENYADRIRAFDLEGCRMVLYSSETVKKLVERTRTVSVPTVVSRRNIEMSRLPEIVSIESGTEVCAFGSSREAALELIGELEETGISHLNLIPYYPGAGAGRPDIIITPGKVFPQMEGARRIIDVEFRNFRISTVMEIFMALNLPAEKLYRVESWYQGEISRLNRYNTVINKSMTGILEAINEGIFCVDETGRVLFCNRIFLNLTGTDYYDVLGRDYREISFGPEMMALVNYDGDLFSEIIEYREKKLLVNRQRNPGAPATGAAKEFESGRGAEGLDRGRGTMAAGFIISVQDVTRISEMETDVRKRLAKKGFVAKYTLDRLIGQSEVIRSKIAEVRKVAQSDYTVLLTGDNGTGKEMFAQAIHNESARAAYPFVAVNLASLSDNIIESEIFGYEEGAFTGALKGGKPGLFEMAHNGTIFIDEIGDVSLHIQQRLLRVLQEREVMRVGGNRVIPVNVRVIAATNRNLFELVQAGAFRIDLYYRLKVLHIHVPRLSERSEDIPLFLSHFFREVKSAKSVSEEALEILRRYEWPGNVRELQNLVYYLETLCENQVVTPADLPEEFDSLRDAEGGAAADDRNTAEDHEEFALILSAAGKKEAADFAFILKQLHLASRSGLAVGRKRLYEMSRTADRPEGAISVEQLRSRMGKLDQYGFVRVGKTRQGSSITQRGETFLAFLIQYLDGENGAE